MKEKNTIKRISEIPSTCFEQYLDLQGPGSFALSQKGIRFAGLSSLSTGYCIGIAEPLATHVVIITKSGEGYIKTADDHIRLTASKCVIVPVGQFLEFGIIDDNWEIIWFYLEDNEHWNSLHAVKCRIFDIPQLFQLHMAVSGYLTESNWSAESSFTPYTVQRTASLYAELIIAYLEEALFNNSQSKESATIRRLEALRQKIRTNPSGDWSQDTMASELDCSASTLQRLVKRHYKMSCWQMVIQIKMEQAKLLLEMTSYPLKVIAARLGYADEFVFSAAFKKHMKISPRQHRNHAKK